MNHQVSGLGKQPSPRRQVRWNSTNFYPVSYTPGQACLPGVGIIDSPKHAGSRFCFYPLCASDSSSFILRDQAVWLDSSHRGGYQRRVTTSTNAPSFPTTLATNSRNRHRPIQQPLLLPYPRPFPQTAGTRHRLSRPTNLKALRSSPSLTTFFFKPSYLQSSQQHFPFSRPQCVAVMEDITAPRGILRPRGGRFASRFRA